MADFKTTLKENSEIVERELLKYLNFHDEKLEIIYDAMRYATLDGGKRIRPFLVIEFCKMYGGSIEAALPFACALEMIHCYSLVHDDLPCMDNDGYRRGKLSTHKKYGEANGVLCGDALLTYAFNVAAQNEFVDSASIKNAVIALSDYAGANGMIGGQILDMLGESEKLDYETFLRMDELKTGCLMRCAAILGCYAAGMKSTTVAEKYAYNIGLAFQMIDDILDKDTDENKVTFLSFMNEKEVKDKAKALLDEAKSIVDSEELKLLCDYLLDRKS